MRLQRFFSGMTKATYTASYSVRKLTNTTVRGGQYRWYATNAGAGSVGSAVAMVR
jgi:hypothetical protein